MFDVMKFGKFFAVINHRGEPVSPGYRDRALVERLCRGWIEGEFVAAEIEDARRANIRGYLARRARRVAKPVAQLELF